MAARSAEQRLAAFGILALALGATAIGVQGALLRRDLEGGSDALRALGERISTQTTTTTWPGAAGTTSLETPRAGDRESVREWLERHAASVDEAQKLPAIAPEWRR